ncbi:hypothetical protein [Stenotrophomonas sp.]|uniref:hypothetical protein n=1 Tax=Stenotrophomonas sp. TaxID=69392 RepID=UPI002FC90653
MKINAGVAMSAVAVCLAIVVTLTGAVFRNYTYFDFEPARCGSDDTWLRVDMMGTFSGAAPSVRGSPYYLRVLRVPASESGAQHPTLQGLTLSSVSTGVEVDSSRFKRYEKTLADGSTAMGYIAEGLDLPYDDYRLTAFRTRDFPGEGADVPVSCLLKKSYREEWRLPWLDALMSV